jgi:hypothetical protein
LEVDVTMSGVDGGRVWVAAGTKVGEFVGEGDGLTVGEGVGVAGDVVPP